MKEIEIEDVSYDGAGVGRCDGKVFFVPKTLPEERVGVEIVQEKSHFCIGRLEKILKKSPLRTAAPCPYFALCGGCDFQHVAYETELQFKKQILQKQLSKCGYFGEIPIERSEKRFFYRNKISFKCKNGKLGFFEAKSNKFFEVKKCLLCDEKFCDLCAEISEFLCEEKIENVREVTIKEVDGAIAFVFLFDEKMLKNLEKLKKIAKKSQKLQHFFVFFAFGEILESNKTKIFSLAGDQKLRKNFGDFFVDLDVSAFEQINRGVAEKLTAFVLSQTEGKRVVNAYSGQGVLSRQMSEHAEFVYAIELQKAAHESAEKLCKNLQNVRCLCGKTEEILPKILEKDKIDFVVLDPPRSGCDREVLGCLKEKKIEKVLYVSCNPATLCRDLEIMRETHEISAVCAFDMFPCTANVETVALLTRKV